MRRLQSATLAAVAFFGLAMAAEAQHASHGQHQLSSPYADLASRPIKALSAAQVEELLNGRGMGLSLPAELNNYPGPKHVLELADKLELSNEQRQVTTVLIEAMTQEAVKVGVELITLETQLEAIFQDRTATAERVADLVGQIGTAQSRLRTIHLNYHLSMAAAMTPQQISKYALLRGYEPQRR